jgi:hypothetical protein
MPASDPRDTFFKLALAAGIAVAGLEVGYLLYSPLPYDPVGYVVGRDFVNTWLGAKLALTGDPGRYFDPLAYNQLLREHFGPNYPVHIWSYPPHLLLFTWPLAFMPYMAGYILYCGIGLILSVAVLSEAQFRQHRVLLLIFSPAALLNIWTGQNGFFISALLVGGLLALKRHPALAGILFGLLSIKPQLGLLLPLMLVLTGHWRTIAVAAATILLLVLATSVAFGTHVWTDYLNDAMPMQAKVFLHDLGTYVLHMPTAFMNARWAGLPPALAMSIQAVISAAAIVAVGWTFWRPRDCNLSRAVLLTATFVVTPYAFNYDMVVFGWVIISLLERSDNDFWDYALMLAVWIVPFLTIPLGVAGLPLSSLPIILFAGKLVWRLKQLQQGEPAATTEETEAAVRIAPGMVSQKA